MRRTLALAFAAFAIAARAAAEPLGTSTETALHDTLDGLTLDPQMPAPAIAVVGDGRIEAAATGVADPDDMPMIVDKSLRLALVTKTFTAAAIPRL